MLCVLRKLSNIYSTCYITKALKAILPWVIEIALGDIQKHAN